MFDAEMESRLPKKLQIVEESGYRDQGNQARLSLERERRGSERSRDVLPGSLPVFPVKNPKIPEHRPQRMDLPGVGIGFTRRLGVPRGTTRPAELSSGRASAPVVGGPRSQHELLHSFGQGRVG